MYEVLIISYDTFRIHHKLLEGEGVCDLLICDEAHRLKNDQTRTSQTLAALQCSRRILLSGTPMQNDLEEFFAMVNFCNPNVLGSVSHFRRYFQSPILVGREPDASDAEVKKSTERSNELSEIVNQFILRRTNTLLARHLPPKLTQIVCVSMSAMQVAMYKHIIKSKGVKDSLKGKQGVSVRVLASIMALKKLCNHPQLLYKPESRYAESASRGMEAESNNILEGISRKFFPPGLWRTGRRRGSLGEAFGSVLREAGAGTGSGTDTDTDTNTGERR